VEVIQAACEHRIFGDETKFVLKWVHAIKTAFAPGSCFDRPEDGTVGSFAHVPIVLIQIVHREVYMVWIRPRVPGVAISPRIALSSIADVARSPVRCADMILSQWGAKFERLLVHLDVDVIDYNDLPLAENYSKNKGLSYSHTLELLEVLCKSPKFAGLTLAEINPDHGAEDGSTIRLFARDLSRTLALSPS
jgi:hypothetical protein